MIKHTMEKVTKTAFYGLDTFKDLFNEKGKVVERDGAVFFDLNMKKDEDIEYNVTIIVFPHDVRTYTLLTNYILQIKDGKDSKERVINHFEMEETLFALESCDYRLIDMIYDKIPPEEWYN